MYEFNEFQSSIEELKIDSYPQEIQDQFYDAINNIPLIKWMVSKDRPRAKDLPKDEDGKIIVDITKPHILEDMDYFKQAAINFRKTGKYTDLRPNPNPNSEYGKWIREEVRRCHEGLVRPSDGEWISGDLYFFWNYCPMSLARKTGKNKKALRVIDFPDTWDGHYMKYHYINACRSNGLHGLELSRRGCGKSFCGASLLAKRFILGESSEVNKKVTCYATASEKKYLVAGDQTLDKFVFDIDFISQNTEFPRLRLIDTLQNMQWIMGYQDLDTNTRKGTLNSVIGVTAKDDESKLRGTRGVLYILEEAGSFPRLLKLWNNLLPSVEDGDSTFGLLYGYGCCCAGTKVWQANGEEVNIEDLDVSKGIIGWDGSKCVNDEIVKKIDLGKKPCVRIITSSGRTLECSFDHPIYKATLHTHRQKNNSDKRIRSYSFDFNEAYKLKVGDKIAISRKSESWGNDRLDDARLIGMLIGDGSYGRNETPKYSSEDEELLNYIKSKYDWSLSASHITKSNKKYEDIRVKGICKMLRDAGIYGQTKTNKRLPFNYKTLDRQNSLLLLAGLFDTDGCVHIDKNPLNNYICLTQSSKEILEQVKYILNKLGVTSNIHKSNPCIKEGRKDKNPWYTLSIKGAVNFRIMQQIPLMQEKKRELLNNILNNIEEGRVRNYYYDNDNIELDTITSIENIGIKTIYNMEVKNTHTYLANNIITHNTAGDNDSDFQAMSEMMYHSSGYHIYSLDNVYDFEGKGAQKFSYFFPGYLNRADCYDYNGNSNVTKALLEILKDRYQMKYNSTDINAITKRTAEIPITPQEAILRTRGSIFPVTDLNERISQLDNNPHSYDDVYVGNLIFDKDNKVSFRASVDLPIRDFPLKDNKAEGAIEIFEMPQKDSNGNIPFNRYILSHDPADNDVADSLSLTSTFVFDLWTDRIVAEFTGRKSMAEDNYEIVRRLCLFYNGKCLYESNKKGIFAYFQKYNCIHLLADTPEYLKDKSIIKSIGYGNTSKGVNATLAVNDYANTLIRDWLISTRNVVEKDQYGNDIEISIRNLFTIRNRALLKELALYNPQINVDRVRSFGMLMIYREEFMIRYGGDVEKAEVKNDEDDLSNDAFFRKNYDEKFID